MAGGIRGGDTREAEDLARGIMVENTREQVLGAIALEYAKAGNLSQAMTLARSLSTPKEHKFSGILHHLLKTKQYEQALQVARQEKIDRTPWMAMALADAGEPTQALAIAESLTAEEISREPMCFDCVISAIAQSFAKQGQLEQALQLAQRFRAAKS